MVDESTMLRLMSTLDNGTNMFGALRPEIRARLFAVVEQPGQETWDEAHAIMIRDDTFRTLWQAVLRHTDYNVISKPSDGPWPAVPTAEQILAALRAELGDR